MNQRKLEINSKNRRFQFSLLPGINRKVELSSVHYTCSKFIEYQLFMIEFKNHILNCIKKTYYTFYENDFIG